MQNETEKVIFPRWIEVSAKIISIVFHPLFVGVMMAFYLIFIHPSYFVGFSEKTKMLKLLAVINNNVFFPLLVVALSVWAFCRSHKHLALRLPIALSGCAGSGLWLVSCPAVAVWLSLHLLPQVKAIQVSDLKQQQVQAIVVLGGGAEAFTHEYDGPNLSTPSMSRMVLVYSVRLSRWAATALPGSGFFSASVSSPDFR
jgi:hypothetical protein